MKRCSAAKRYYTAIAGCCLIGMHSNGAQHEQQQEDSIAVQVAPIHSYNRGVCDNSVICNSLGSHNKAVFKSNLLRILEM